MASFEISQKIVGINEGGYQNLADDSGNWYKGVLIGTNWGIAAPTLASFLGRTPTVADMKNLSRATAESILKRNYWLKNHFDKLKNQSVATLLYDGAVNHGVGGILSITKKALARLKHPISKVFTSDGISELNKLNQKDLFFALKQVRTERYKASPKKQYLKGWLKRLERIKFVPESNTKDIILGLALLLSGIALFLLGL
jgi:lysozyme family protein